MSIAVCLVIVWLVGMCEINVIQKNIREREELAKKLGIDTIADELKKTAKDYKYTDDS